jgi:hypothetical protein
LEQSFSSLPGASLDIAAGSLASFGCIEPEQPHGLAINADCVTVDDFDSRASDWFGV